MNHGAKGFATAVYEGVGLVVWGIGLACLGVFGLMLFPFYLIGKAGKKLGFKI